MSLRHRKAQKRDMDERYTLPEDTDPDEVLRRLLGTKPADEQEDKEEAES